MIAMQLQAPVVPQGLPVVSSMHTRLVQQAWAELHVWPEPAQGAAPHMPFAQARPEQQSGGAVHAPPWPRQTFAAPQGPSVQIIEQQSADFRQTASVAWHTPASLVAAPPSGSVPASGGICVVHTPAPSSLITQVFGAQQSPEVMHVVPA